MSHAYLFLSGTPPLMGLIECDIKMHVTSKARLKEALQPLSRSLRIFVLQMLPLKETNPLGNQQPCCEKPKPHVGRCSTQRSQSRCQACKGRCLQSRLPTELSKIMEVFYVYTLQYGSH